MLARATAKDENLHCFNDLWRMTATAHGQGLDGTISLTLWLFAPRIRRYVIA
jgi:hypothetical protein